MDITLSIQIMPEGDRSRRDEVYRTLDGWRKGCISMGNLVMLHLLTQENVANMIYLTDEVQARLGNSGTNAIFNTSRQNATYRILSKNDLPSDIINNVNSRAYSYFNRNKKDIFKGKMRVPYYQNNTPIPFSKKSITFFAENGDKRMYKFRLFKYKFICILGKDKAGYSYRLDRILEGSATHGNASLYFNKRNSKWFLLLPIPAEEARPDINPDLKCYAELKTDIPIVAHFGSEVHEIGTAEEFTYRRRQISEKLRRLQMDTRFSRGGKGREQKLQALERFEKKERNYVHDKLHKYSAALIGKCIRKGYGTIILNWSKEAEDLADAETYESITLRRYWSAAELCRLIKYKAQANGIRVLDG